MIGIASSADQSTNPVTAPNADACHGLSVTGLDHPCDFQPRNVGGTWRRCIPPHALKHIRAIDTRRRHTNQHLTFCSHRHGALRQAKHFRSAKSREFNDSHEWCRHDLSFYCC